LVGDGIGVFDLEVDEGKIKEIALFHKAI